MSPGSPTVMLEAGAGMVALRLVHANIGKVTRVYAYDRGGLDFGDRRAPTLRRQRYGRGAFA